MKIVDIFNVRGNVALVTGAASGLGLAFAEVMADNGAHVVMVDIDEKGLSAAADKLKGRGLAVETAVVDVSDHEKLIRTIDDAAKKHGRLDAVFANAGISTGSGYATEAGKITGQIQNISIDLWKKAVRTNLTSVFATIKAAAPHMKAQRSGRIIVTSSRAALRADSRSGHPYATMKAAMAHLVRTTARELAPYNVIVNAIAPGPFITNIGGGALHTDEKLRAAFASFVPLGRMATTDEIKGLALFLASPASSFVSGTLIPIDGGSST
jgi:NAD(P)-dependent dehydrogenase (short-subunit alcohol dehydrogenase family)